MVIYVLYYVCDLTFTEGLQLLNGPLLVSLGN